MNSFRHMENYKTLWYLIVSSFTMFSSVMARMIQFTIQVKLFSLEYEDKAWSNQETLKNEMYSKKK